MGQRNTCQGFYNIILNILFDIYFIQVASGVLPSATSTKDAMADEVADSGDEAVDESEGEEPMDDIANVEQSKQTVVKAEPVSAHENTTDNDVNSVPSEKAMSAADEKPAQFHSGTPKPISTESGRWFF